MTKWDSHTAPTLRLITELSAQIGSRAKQLQSALRDLPARPDFVTKAEAELDDAIHATSNAVKLMRQAHDQYARLPVEPVLQAAE